MAFFHTKAAIAKQNNCFLVEGYTDVIQFHQSGIENVVAFIEFWPHAGPN
jgi:DNA primase